MFLISSLPIELRARYESTVDRSGGANACWPWTKSLDASGVGQFQFRVQGKAHNFKASRVAYELVHGALPEGLKVTSECGNRACCNPAHLRATEVPKRNPGTEKRLTPDQKAALTYFLLKEPGATAVDLAARLCADVQVVARSIPTYSP